MSATRIVCTIGPATDNESALRDLAAAGMNVARLNGSHGDLDWCSTTIALLHEVVPEVLVSGHHERVRTWRREQAERITRERRPDLWSRHVAARDASTPEPRN